MDMSRNFSGNDPNPSNPYGSDDAFDTYIDMDFLRNDAMEEDVDFGNMSNSDLFRYYLEGELVKDTEGLDQPPPPPPTNYSTSMQTVTNDFPLVTSPAPPTEDLKLTPVAVIEESEIAQQAIATTSLAILNAQLAELLAKLPTIKQETTTDKITLSTSPTSPKSNVTQTVKSANSVNSNNNAQKSDDNQIDMKKLSSKERRQIRNKISARNFRVRRKEYIQNLETTKEQQQEEINLLRQALLHLQEENTKLQQEVEELRKQKQQNTKSIVTSPPSPPHTSSSSATTSEDNNNIISSLSKNTNNNNNNGNISQFNVNQIKGPQSHQPSSPASRYLIPNVNKDASPSSSSSNQKAWQDSRVRVQTTLIPEFNLDKHLFEEKSTFSYPNSYPYRYPSMINLIEFSQSIDGQRFWLAYMLVSTAMQRMTNLFIEAVCATPKSQMISAFFPNVKPSVLECADEAYLQTVVNEEEKKSEESLQSCLKAQQLNNEIEVQETSLFDSNTMVESVKDASVLDWLYDAMVRHVVEQSQMEAKTAELSDWVGEEWDDNVLPSLF